MWNKIITLAQLTSHLKMWQTQIFKNDSNKSYCNQRQEQIKLRKFLIHEIFFPSAT